MRLLYERTKAMFVALPVSLALLAYGGAGCGGAEEQDSPPGPTGGSNLNPTAGRGGTSTTPSGPAGTGTGTGTGSPGAGGARTTMPTTSGSTGCSSGLECNIDLASLASLGGDGIGVCTGTQGTCSCAIDDTSLSTDGIEGLLSGKTTTLQGTWVCQASDRGNSRDRGRGGAGGGNSASGVTTGRGGGTSTPAVGSAGSTPTNVGCPTTAPQNSTACTLDGYFCSGCICAGGKWTCT